MGLEKAPDQQPEELGPERMVELEPEELGAAAARRELRAEVLPELLAELRQGVKEVRVSLV